MRRCSRLSAAIRFLRALVIVVLVPVFALRPPGVEAVLLHEHGDDGRHFHLVSNVEADRGRNAHAVWHEQEHARQDHDPSSATASATHTEECGSLFIVFAPHLVVRAANPPRADCDHVPSGSSSNVPVAVLISASPFPASPPSSATWPPIPLVGRTTARILSSNHSLLI